MEKQIIRIHRVGSVTFGILLVLTGILFLSRLFLPGLNYEVVLHFWPLILISLGVEVLLGCTRKTYEIRDETGKVLEQNKIIYDVAAIVLTMVLTGFSVIMGILDFEWRSSSGIYW